MAECGREIKAVYSRWRDRTSVGGTTAAAADIVSTTTTTITVHSSNIISKCERKASANARRCTLLCGFSVLASSGYIWCDGGNKTYFGWIFRMLFRVNHLLCLCVCVCAMRPSPFYMCFETTISTMRIVDKIYPFFPVRSVCLCMNRIIIYFNLNVFTVHVECFSVLRS